MPSMEDLNNFEKMHYPENHSWGLDKKIPVALIFVVVAQILIFTWQAATLSSEVKNNGAAIERIEVHLEKMGVRDDLIISQSQTKEASRRESDRLEKKNNAIDDRVHTIERTRFTKEMWDNYKKTP